MLSTIASTVSIYAADNYVTLDVIITKGIPYTINPVSDLGITPTKVLSVSAPGTIGKVVHNGSASYQISDASSFLIEPIQYYAYKSSYINVPSRYYYAYKLTANQTGIYTFKQNIEYYTQFENVSYNSEITYNITVVDVVSIIISPSLTLHIGDNYTFEPTITDSRASTVLTWQSSNSFVATIDANGQLITNSLGSTTITCTAHNGVSAQCEVTVTPVFVSSIILNQTEAELVAGEKLNLSAIVAPDNATNKSISWSSTNEAVAVVSESGLVTAVGSGTCQVKATANDGSGKSASCLVTVLGNVMFCEDFGAVPNATVTLPIQLTNADAIQGFEFKLVLPEGVSVQADGGGKLLATLTDRVSTQGLEGANQGNGIYQFVFTSTARIQGNSGAVVNIPIVVANNVALGQYDVIVKDVELVKYGTSSQIHHSDRTATLTIKEMTLGDVNGDGRISVADATSIINYVLGRMPVSFILVAADVNGDNDITLADAVATVDKILAGGNAGARAAIRNIMSLDPQ